MYTHVLLFPLALGGRRLPMRLNPPMLGEHSDELLASLGYSNADIAKSRTDRIVGRGAADTSSIEGPSA